MDCNLMTRLADTLEYPMPCLRRENTDGENHDLFPDLSDTSIAMVGPMMPESSSRHAAKGFRSAVNAKLGALRTVSS
jgi:hypothetical protein